MFFFNCIVFWPRYQLTRLNRATKKNKMKTNFKTICLLLGLLAGGSFSASASISSTPSTTSVNSEGPIGSIPPNCWRIGNRLSDPTVTGDDLIECDLDWTACCIKTTANGFAVEGSNGTIYYKRMEVVYEGPSSVVVRGFIK